MKNSKKVTFLVENGISLKTISKMNQGQINLMVERFKKFKKEENKEEVKQTVTNVTYDPANASDQKTLAQKGIHVDPTTKKISMTLGSTGEVKEDSSVDKDNTTAGQITQDPHQVQAPDGMDDLGDATIDKEEDLATEGVIKEKFESKAQQGLFWARCNKCSDKKCKWCKMAKEFSDSTSKKQYKEMPEKKHPEKSVSKKEKTNEETQQYWENKILGMLEEEKKKKSQKKDSESMILRKPKKVTMFSDEAPMELPIAKMFSIGKK